MKFECVNLPKEMRKDKYGQFDTGLGVFILHEANGWHQEKNRVIYLSLENSKMCQKSLDYCHPLSGEIHLFDEIPLKNSYLEFIS